MPRKYPDETKHETIGILQIHDDISFTHCATAVHQRILHRWCQRLPRRQTATLSEKDFSLSAKRTKTDKIQIKSQPKTNPTPIPDAAMQPTARGGIPPQKTPLYRYCVDIF